MSGGLVVLAWSGFADAAGKSPVLAQALFEEARHLVAAEKFDQACPKFKASYELDPAGGTLLNLADCYDHQGKVALAWTTFKDALESARQDGKSERAEFASRHLASLEKRLSHLKVVVPDAARVPGLEVTVDDTPVAEAAYGVELPVDPGSHRVRASAPGKQAYERSVQVPSASPERLLIEVPTLTEANASPTPNAAQSGPTAPRAGVHETTTTPSSTSRTLGFVVGGAGIVAVGVGSYFGLKAFAHWDARNSACTGGCTSDAKTAGDDAKSAATVSTIGFAAGVVALGAGLVLILTSPSSKESAPPSAHVGKLRVGLLTSPNGGQLCLGSNWSKSLQWSLGCPGC